MPSHLDTLRRIHALAITRGPLSPVDADLDREAGMAGDYGQLLQAARDLDSAATEAPAPTAHTPGPWSAEPWGRLASAIRNPGNPYTLAQVYNDNRSENAQANAARIVACVNACAGITDPGAALAEVRAILTDLLPKVEDDASRPGDRWAPLAVRRALALLGAK